MICFIDYRTTDEEIQSLKKLDLIPIKVPKSTKVYEAINGHVDIQLNILYKEKKLIIVQKDIDKEFLDELSMHDINYVLSKNSLSSKYPDDIILNALISDSIFIHNLKYTDKNLLPFQKNKKIIDVKQGYTKCSVLPVGHNAFVTSDKGIYTALKEIDMECLLLPPGDIELPSLNYGFIGGIGGLISPEKLVIFGELDYYKYGDELYKFLYKMDVEPISLKKGRLYDRGSLFVI
ncbi:hypothetical protein SAMN04487886_10011 [Clostridium sp. DSM 8431]|uniref:DUF6873 family GME fold protein n=1 Tax=Clostridium sp. DSM 8431 TaxID=1761781 RepID=UPI0008E961CF|nr:hypothetical protein [Clostridium sp. DSM 8431]SFU28105.1 hypothetical protein SAMN04487886_10011 [Clostridium sp. DSM 8431]